MHLSSNGNLNLNTSLDVDDDLLDGLGGGEQAILEEETVSHASPHKFGVCGHLPCMTYLAI